MDYRQLYLELIEDLHHRYRGPICTLEGLLNVIDLVGGLEGRDALMLSLIRKQVEKMKAHSIEIARKHESHD
jgi:hypothetical protein